MSFVNLSISHGKPTPLGSSLVPGSGINFAVFAPRARSVDLCLYWKDDSPDEESARVRLVGQTHGVWHVEIKGLPKACRYGYRVDGDWKPEAGLFFNHRKLLLDPYARLVDQVSCHHASLRSRSPEGQPDLVDSGPHAPKAVVVTDDSFNWEGTSRPCIPMSECVFYEAHVKGFSKLNQALPDKLRGTYAGLAHPKSIAYLKNLGVTTVQLLPVHHHLDDGFLLERGLSNYWGYNTLAFFAPERRYAATDDPVREFREMTRSFHREGMEIILDVVFNHTCEGGVNGPTCLFRGFDNVAYYRASPNDPGSYDDVTGCGNSVNIAQRDAMQLVMDSLRYWVTEMGVDGFRFDLAATLGRDPRDFNPDAVFFRAAYQDPVLRQIKLIAEPWDIGRGGYQQGNFPIDWCELNGKYRDCVRRFWRGDPKVMGEFATRITGSADLFAHNGRKPTASLNMITSHDGFTLRDLVSYNHKHNEANCELNRDGDSHNLSYNYGVEGETEDHGLKEIRKRQVRNFLATLICSQGVPFLTAGDESFRTQLGNNNAYCQDNDLNWLEWDDRNSEAVSMQRFVRKMAAFRRENSALRKGRFFSGNQLNGSGHLDITWLNTRGEPMNYADWGVDQSGAFMMMIHRETAADSSPAPRFLLFCFNARLVIESFTLPASPPLTWECQMDTVDAEGECEKKQVRSGQIVHLAARSLQIWRELG